MSMVVIMDMSKRHGGYAWRVYDEKLRRVRALSSTMPWHVTNWDRAMDDIHANVPYGRSAAPAPFHAEQRPTGKGYCSDYNSHDRCNRKPCQYAHACSNCGRQGHARRTCRSDKPCQYAHACSNCGRQGHARRTCRSDNDADVHSLVY